MKHQVSVDVYDAKTNRYLMNYPSVKEAAEDLDIPANTISANLHGATRTVRGMFYFCSDKIEWERKPIKQQSYRKPRKPRKVNLYSDEDGLIATFDSATDADMYLYETYGISPSSRYAYKNLCGQMKRIKKHYYFKYEETVL